MKQAESQHTVIVGGTRGIGRELVRVLADQGHVVSVLGRRAPPEIDSQLTNVDYWAVDILEKDQLETTLGEIVSKNGNLNSLVFFQRFRGAGDSWEGEIQTSLSATKNTVDYLADKFRPGEDCSIVAVSSIASHFIADEQPLSYHIGKSGLGQMVRYYAVELGRRGIRVNSVSPGTVIKEESSDFYAQNRELRDLYESITPLGRMGTAADVANVAAFLCSPQASFVTGQNIVVDGGVSLRGQESLARKLTMGSLNVTRGPERESE
jgi:3-oxoacyl-[acyl-carrier protein] reductase